MNKWHRIISAVLAVVLVVGLMPAVGIIFPAAALRVDADRDYTVGEAVDYSAVFEDALIVVPGIGTDGTVNYLYRGRAVSEPYTQGRHFAYVSDAIEASGGKAAVFYLAAGNYSGTYSFPAGSVVLGANAGVNPNGQINFDLPDVTKGWAAADRFDETVLSDGIVCGGNIVIDGISYSGTGALFLSDDTDPLTRSEFKVTVQNSLITGIAAESAVFDTSASYSDGYGFDIKDTRITATASEHPFCKNTYAIHTDGVYFYNNSGRLIGCDGGFAEYNFSLDLYRSYFYKNSTGNYNINVSYTSGDHVSHLIFDKFLWYEGNKTDFGFVRFYTTPDTRFSSYKVDVINSTFLADKSYNDCRNLTVVNGNQSDYQLGTYTINFNNNRVIGFASMFPNVSGQGGTHKIHADFNNNYFAPSFTSVTDALGKRSEYYNYTDKHGTNAFNNIDYARIDLLNYYTDYAMTLSDKTFYVNGISFYDNVDYVSIDNKNSKVTVGMREGSVQDPEIYFENSAVSAKVYTDSNCTKECTSFSAPARGSISTYYVQAVCGSTQKKITLYVYGEEAVPYFKNAYVDSTGVIKNTAYLLCDAGASGNIEVEFDGSPYIFTVGQNAFSTVDKILAASDGVPQIILPYGDYKGLAINGDCDIYGQNRRTAVASNFDNDVVTGTDWVSGKSARLFDSFVSAGNVTFSGVEFADTLDVDGGASVSVINSKIADVDHAGGTGALVFDGCAVSSDTLVVGTLPSTVTVNGCYFKNGAAVSSARWDSSSYDAECMFTVNGCLFDGVTGTVVTNARQGVSEINSDIGFAVTDNIFLVDSADEAALSIKPAAYGSLDITGNRFVSKTDSGAPIYFDNSVDCDTLTMTNNRFIGFARIDTATDEYPVNGSNNYFARYTEDYKTANNGTVIPGAVYCSDYYEDYAMTSSVPSVSDYSFSDAVTVSGRRLYIRAAGDTTDISAYIIAECGVEVRDRDNKKCDITALDSRYDSEYYTLSFYNKLAPFSRVVYQLWLVRSIPDGCNVLSVTSDVAHVERDEYGVYNMTLPASLSQADISVLTDGGEAELYKDGVFQQGIFDIPEGKTCDYEIRVSYEGSTVRYRLSVYRPMSSGVAIDYDEVVKSAYIIGADRFGDNISFYYRGKTLTLAYNELLHFDSFDEAYGAYLATDPDIINDTPVFVFAAGDYGSINVKYRAVILGANAGIAPVESTATSSLPYDLPKQNPDRSVTETTRFFGGIIRPAADSELEDAENTSDSRLELYTVADGIDVVSDAPFINEDGERRHKIYFQNVVSSSPLATGGGKGDITLKNVRVDGLDLPVTSISTDSVTVEDSYINGVRADTLFDGVGDSISVKNSFITGGSRLFASVTGAVRVTNSILSSVDIEIIGADLFEMRESTHVCGTLAVGTGIAASVSNNRFIGSNGITADSIGVNYHANGFTDETDIKGIPFGKDWYINYKMTLKRSDFNVVGIEFESGVHEYTVDNGIPFIDIVLTSKEHIGARFITAGSNVTAQLECNGIFEESIAAGNTYTLILKKGDYEHTVRVSVGFEDVGSFADSDGIGIIKNTAVMIAPDIIADDGDGRVIEWQGKKFKYVYGQNLFASMDEARKKLDGHIQMMLPAYDFEDAIIMPVDTSVYGVNFDVDPNIKSDVLGDDWVKNPEWGRYGQTEIKNISVPYEATGTLIELYGITLRGRIYDGDRSTSPLCTEFNIINTLVEHEDWMETIYGGTSNMYTITLTNANSTAGSSNNDRGCIKNMRVEKLRVNPEVSANRNRLLNERLPGDFTVEGLYIDMKKADCSLIGWMKMSTYQKNGKLTWKNCNLRNAIDVSASLNLAFEGRDHAEVASGESVVVTIENCTFYNVQNSRKSAIQLALQAYSEINIKNNLFLQPSSTNVQVFNFTPQSTLAKTRFNVQGNRFVGTKNTISLTTGTGSFSLADNYYAAYTADYRNGTEGKALSGTKATCSSYYLDYALRFKNTDLKPYAFGNGMEWDIKNKTLSLTYDEKDGGLLNLNNYVVSNPSSHTIAVADVGSIAAIPLSEGENVFTVTVGGKDVYTLTVYFKSIHEQLEEKIGVAAAIVNSDEFSQYTQQSASALRLAYNDARRALASSATSTQLLSALTTLTDAIDNVTVDTASLFEKVASCPDNADGRYTAESFAELISVIDKINNTSSFSPAIKLQYENELDCALAALVDRSEFDNAVKKARGENIGVYSYDTAKAFIDRINEIADSAVIVTAADVARETERIKAAYSLLVKNTVRLESARNSVKALRMWDWTSTSYVSALDAAAAAADITQNSTQSEIDSAAKAIEDALSSLVGTKVFGEVMRRAEAMTNDGMYSQASWSEFENVLRDVTVSAMEYTTTEQSLEGANRIAIAIASLATDASALESALTRAQNCNRVGFTTASVAALDAAISAARNIGDNPTQAQIDALVSQLNGAMSSLVSYAPLNNALAAIEAINNNSGIYCASSYTAFRAKLTSLRSRINSVADTAQSQAFLKETEDAKKLLTLHNYVYKDNNDATCKKLGTKTGTCACGAKTTVQVQGSFAAHKCNSYTYNNDATYATDGTKSGNCIWCGIRVTIKADGTRLTVSPIDSAKKFKDVKAGAWYKNAVDYSVGAGFISGMSDTEFGVSTPVTRGMFITILARIAGVDTSKNANSTTTKFTDVGYGKYYTAAIKWAVANGVANGMSNTQFAPDNAIQRQQLCVMIVNFAKFCGVSIGKAEPAIAFADEASIGNYAKNAVSICQMADIVNGYPEGSRTVFKPQNTATRAEAAQILYKFHSTYVAK